MSDMQPAWQVTVIRIAPQVYRVELAGRTPAEFATYVEVLQHLEALFRQVEATDAPERPASPSVPADTRPFDLEEARLIALARPDTDDLLGWAHERYAALGENWLAGFRAGLCRLALHDPGEGFMEGYQAGRALNRTLASRC